MELTNDKKIDIGKLGKINFSRGYYLYVGSALNGLEQRIKRHLRNQKKIYWHIDYLLQHAKIVDIYYKESERKEECKIAQIFDQYFSLVPGFGSSDCGCKSHLFYGFKKGIIDIIEKLQMKNLKTICIMYVNMRRSC
jgi:Uri superfamily endonuclease